MGAAENAIEEEVRAMRASQIKQTLEEMSVATKGVYEVCVPCDDMFLVCDTGTVSGRLSALCEAFTSPLPVGVYFVCILQINIGGVAYQF